jgi:hypothetical protein
MDIRILTAKRPRKIGKSRIELCVFGALFTASHREPLAFARDVPTKA